MRPDNVKSILAIVGSIGAVGVSFAGGVWLAAQWTSAQEYKYAELKYRVDQIESANKGSSPGRVDRIEYRLDQIEKTNIEDRAARRQYEADIKKALDEINNTLLQVQILLGPKLPRR